MRSMLAVAVLGAVASVAIGCDEKKNEPATTAAPSGSAASAAAPASATASAAPKPTMDQMIAKTTKEFTDAWNAHDAKKIASLFAANGASKVVGMPDAVGRDAITTATQMNFTAFPDFKVGVARIFQKGNVAVAEWVVTGTNKGEFMGQKPTDRAFGLAGASVLTFDEEGMIKEEHRYGDMPTIASQLDPKAKAGTFRAPAALPTGATEVHVAKGTPDEQKTLDEGKAMYVAFESRKVDELLKFVTDDTVVDDMSQAAPPAKGPKGLKDMMAMFTTAFPDYTQNKPVQFAVDGYVITEGTMSGTQKGALGPIKATNKPFTVHFVDVFQMKDGKVAKGVTYMNGAELLVQLGVMPPMGAPPAASASPAAAAKK